MSKLLELIKKVVFPIEKSELKTFSKLALLLFCILFNFSSLRSLKDGLVIPLIGAEAISFLKLWLVLPSAVLLTVLYVKLSNKFNIEQLFTILVSCFVCCFAIFAFVIYPNQEDFHMAEDKVILLSSSLPNFKWFIRLLGRWSYVVVYILAELWGAMVINLMFWQFVNHLFRSDQAQRLYPILGMFGSMGLICSGNFLVFFSRGANLSHFFASMISSRMDEIEITIKLITFSVVLSSIAAILLFRNVYSNTSSHVGQSSASKEQKVALGVWESLKLIYHSRYIFYIFLLVISYGLAINILEGPWKAKLSQLYTNPCDYIKFMGQFNIWMGFSSVIMTIIGGNVLRIFGWTVSAYITPVMITVTGCLFFIFVLFGDKMEVGFDPIYIAVMIGAIQNILSKSSKYSLFDSTKEMTYIPLSAELKSKGKAAVEVIGAKFGKSLGAFLQFVAFTIVPDLDFDRISVFLMVIFIAISIIWLIDVGRLGKEYQRLNNAKDS